VSSFLYVFKVLTQLIAINIDINHVQY